jgi:hypothetical protein
MENLSRYLRNIVSEMDADFVNDAPKDEKADAAAWIASEMTTYLLESIEGFKVRTKIPALEALFAERNKVLTQFLEGHFDECYTRQLLERIPKMVSRTMGLSLMLPRKMPSSATNMYLKEATRSYILGLWQGSIALSRAAVEHGLREETSKLNLKNPAFYELITAATRLRLLDDEHAKMASQVERMGNQVLHGTPSNKKIQL